MKINVIGSIEKVYSFLPKLGSDLKSYVVAVIPSLSLVFGLLITLSSVLELLGTPFISLFSMKSSNLPVIQILLITNVIGIFQGLLMVFAWKPLRKKLEKGWRFLVWSQILWIISMAFSLSSSAIFGLVLLYPIIQVKSEYK